MWKNIRINKGGAQNSLEISIFNFLERSFVLPVKPYIKSMYFLRDVITEDMYPYNIPSLSNVERIDFHPDITFIIGENGSGKSTIIEALVVHLGFGPEGGTKNVNLDVSKSTSDLYKYGSYQEEP